MISYIFVDIATQFDLQLCAAQELLTSVARTVTCQH